MPFIRNKKVILFFCCICLMVHVFNIPASAGQKKYKFKLASLAPKAMGWARHTREVAHPYLKKETDGNLKIKWYWGGVMGNDKDYIQKMKIGQLHGAAFTGQGTVLAIPEMAVLELPFLFNNYAEVDYIKQKMWQTFDTYAEKRGYKLIVWVDQDFDQIYSVSQPLARMEEFPKTKFLTWYGPLEEMLLKQLDVSPIPVNVTEITPSIRQGVADTLIAPAIWVVGSQIYTVLKYVNPVKIRYSPVTVVVTKKAFDSIPKDYQKVVMNLRNDVCDQVKERIRSDNVKSYAAMVKYGVKETQMSAQTLAQLKTNCRKVWDKAAGKEFPKSLLTELLGHLETFRAIGKK